MTDYDVHATEKIQKYQTIESGTGFLCMFSGGKDSGLAMAIAQKMGAKPIALLHILDGENSLYHNQKKAVIEAQARAMNLPLIYMPYKWWHNNWEQARKDLKNLHVLGASRIVFGDIRLKYIFLGDIPLCEKAGYGACLPIGGICYDDLMDLIERHQIVSIITKINHPAISRDLLGTQFTREVYQYMRNIGIDPFGELDEFHTTLVNADYFLAPLRYHLMIDNQDTVSVIIE